MLINVPSGKTHVWTPEELRMTLVSIHEGPDDSLTIVLEPPVPMMLNPKLQVELDKIQASFLEDVSEVGAKAATRLKDQRTLKLYADLSREQQERENGFRAQARSFLEKELQKGTPICEALNKRDAMFNDLLAKDALLNAQWIPVSTSGDPA